MFVWPRIREMLVGTLVKMSLRDHFGAKASRPSEHTMVTPGVLNGGTALVPATKTGGPVGHRGGASWGDKQVQVVMSRSPTRKCP